MGIQTGGLAGKARAATPVLANFRQLAGERVVNIQPLAGRLIEPEALERLRGGHNREDGNEVRKGLTPI